MAVWPFKPRPTPETDIDEARRLRVQATAEVREAVQTGTTVAQLTSYLAERRALNHFGDDLSISFKRRRGHA